MLSLKNILRKGISKKKSSTSLDAENMQDSQAASTSITRLSSKARRQNKIAIFIDTENANPKDIPKALAYLNKCGKICLKQAYGSTALLKSPSWRNLLRAYNITPMYCEGSGQRKNSVDIHIVVDAMNTPAQSKIETFVIFSSDSDYAPLLDQISERGKQTFVFGTALAAKKYQQVCDKFIVLEDMAIQTRKSFTPQDKLAKELKPRVFNESLAELLIVSAFELSPRGGWCNMHALSICVRRYCPWFTAKAYGCRSLSKVLIKTGCFEVERKGGTIYARPKDTMGNPAQ